ncbi:MAG: ATP-binding protein [Gemmatimonadales bacterium]|nr:ATP-binding protein [Gemmatimonadales bacterium]
MTVTLNPLYRFDTFVVGSANRLAVTAAKAVAESPGTVYNPLFVYARPGLGKTHLLMGLGHAARAINPALQVEYLTLDEFVEAFHAAIAAGHGEAYRKRFLDVDLLLVDDVQFLTHRREMQAELLRLTDALQTANRQIVLTGDRPPAEIEALDERLIRRFAGGLIIDVSAPDYETRVAILRRKAEERRASFAEGVLEAVAGLDIDNVRELLGALNRLVAFQAVSEKPIDAEQARTMIGGTPVQRIEVAAAATRGRSGAGAPPPARLPEPPPPADEFSDFLTEISATVAQQVDAWRSQIGAAILRWEGEGYRTGRLQKLLDQEVVPDPGQALRDFECDVQRLRDIEAETAELAGDLAGAAAFRDPGDLAAAESLRAQAREGAVPPAAPSPLWRLDHWQEGSSAKVAAEAARAVVQEPGARYNPLVIVGGGGAGKTHLLHAIGNALMEGSDPPVACLSAPEYTGELIQAIDRDAVGIWRSRYRRVAAFLLDDVHLIADTDRTQDELFLLYNVLLEAGRQMIFTSAVPLAELGGLEPRLRTRLEGGLVVELPPPDRMLRERVSARELEAKIGAADQALVDHLAARPVDSVRMLVAQVQRVLNAAEARNVPPSVALAREVLDGVAPGRPADAPRAGQTRRPPGQRGSGIVAPTAGGARSREKMVWEWPELADRLLEDWR